MVVSYSWTDTEEERALKKITFDKIVVMILKCLPVKSLVRFMSVSQAFLKAISGPRFFMVHSLHSLSHRNPELLFILHDLDFVFEGTNFRYVYRFCRTDLQGNTLSKFEVVLHQDPIKLMLPSLLGLVCFAMEKGTWLCNPSIPEYLELPPCPSLAQGDRLLGFGFGYLDSIKGFKVVQLMLRASGSDCSSPKIDCWVYNHTWSAENRSWRFVKGSCPYLVSEFSHSAFNETTIYWKIDRSRYPKLWRDNDFLVAFNIEEEEFRVITHPEGWTYSEVSKVHIAKIAGSLFMMETSDSGVNMWFLRNKDKCIWYGPERFSTTGHTLGRPVRVAELKYYVKLNGLLVFGSKENVVVLYCMRQRSFSKVVLPFNAVDFTPFYVGLYKVLVD